MYKAINCSLVTSIHKSPEAKTIKDMRHISCCSTIYKIIFKILTTRLGKVLNKLIEDIQSAFVSGRTIHDNIMLAQELVRGYNRKHVFPRCMVQMEIQKAYDIVEWQALAQVMIKLGFHQVFNY
ncbi:unnamed protein product [Lathyrus sativus]|nr:unnamed protein product [Lathyrus sativus]